MLVCMCMLPSSPSSAEEEFPQETETSRTLLVVVGKESRSRLVKFPSCIVSVASTSIADRK